VDVAVRDTGIGIPPHALPQLFDLFSQVDRSLERSTSGLGIGLALVQGIVAMHGGSVRAESAGLGTGSTFTVRLPILPPEGALPAFPEPLEPEAGAGGPRRRFLVADDNLDAANSLALLLRLFGHEVQVAHDGLEALEVAERFRPEVVLMDVGMPVLNGHEATRRIRAEPWGQKMRILALTGWGQDSDKLLSQEAGCDAHLVKPILWPDLETVLAELEQKPTR
jgi:CheY-like chemotaxis protein